MESWADIEKYEGRYQISNYGRVKSLQRVVHKGYASQHTINEKILSTFVNNNGYECVIIHEKKVKKHFTVHQLVAKAFCDGFEEGKEVNHIDGVRLNNNADNLEWVTRKENIRDVMSRGMHNVSAAHAVAHIKRKKEVDQYDLEGNYIKTFQSLRDAMHASGAHESKISMVCNGHRRTAGGFMWKFAN